MRKKRGKFVSVQMLPKIPRHCDQKEQLKRSRKIVLELWGNHYRAQISPFHAKHSPPLGRPCWTGQQLSSAENRFGNVTVPRQKFANFSRFPRVPHQTFFYPHFQITMPRRPLAEISANSNQRGGIEGRFELTSNWHSHIVDCACGGQSLKTIAEDLQISLSTIYSTVSCNKTRFDNESLHQPGRPNIVSDSLCRRLLREVRANPKI